MNSGKGRVGGGASGGGLSEVRLDSLPAIPEEYLQAWWQSAGPGRGWLRTMSGELLRIDFPGFWNAGAGPDFRQARIATAEGFRVGDIELHIDARDWVYHGHPNDPAFDRVVLHAFLFADPSGRPTRTCSGHSPVELPLLPCLPGDLEQFCQEQATLQLDRRATGGFRSTGSATSLSVSACRRRARSRWREKVLRYRRRLKRAPLETVAHETCLEVLGFRANRAPMLRLAQRFPLAFCRRVGPAAAWALYEAEGSSWNLRACRPANHPFQRLRQYLTLAEAAPDWPSRLIAWLEVRHGEAVPPGPNERRAVLESLFAEPFLPPFLGGTRRYTWLADGVWPLAEALFPGGPWLEWWEESPAGDFPEALRRMGRGRGIPARRMRSNGWCQGALAVWSEASVRF